MQSAIAEYAARAAGLEIPPGVVTSLEAPTRRQAQIHASPAWWRGLARTRRDAADRDRAEGQMALADRNDRIADFYEGVGRLAAVPVPPPEELLDEGAAHDAGDALPLAEAPRVSFAPAPAPRGILGALLGALRR